MNSQYCSGSDSVEAPLLVQLGDQLRRRPLAEHRDRRIARDEMHEQERHDRHADRDRQDLRQSPQRVGETIHDVPARLDAAYLSIQTSSMW